MQKSIKSTIYLLDSKDFKYNELNKSNNNE